MEPKRDPEPANALAGRSHPLRAALSDEMHLRRLPRIASPARLMQVVTLLGEGGEAASHNHVAALIASAGGALPDHAKFAAFAAGAVTIVWERHTEFASYTFIRPGPFEAAFDPAIFGPAARDILAAIPGEVIRATQIALLPRVAPEPPPALLADYFDFDRLVVSDVAGGSARIYSDFRLHADGFGRLLIADRGLAGEETELLIQRLQELGNYRNMALLGLPLAQRLTPQVTALERRLAALTGSVSERLSQDDSLLGELSFLSAELARLLAETGYRMSATRAYAQISFERLERLGGAPVRGYQTLEDFTERRLQPAVRTCESFSARLDDLSQRAAWTSALLRTRIDTALARQSHDLLVSMNSRARLQLRLQQTVEGLSVVAISYYLVALIAYVLAAIPGLRREIALAVTAPLVILFVGLMVWRLRRRLRD
jgi:uncharacterized membrane-anchored protein